jgi:formamidopyrimidine-DNA glycosylase
MPELPEVETIVRGLREKLIGWQIRSVQVRTPTLLRSPLLTFRKQLKGAIIRKIERKGKFILIVLGNGSTLIIHLKMTGQLLLIPEGRPADQHTHLIFKLQPRDLQLRYRDVRKFGFLVLLTPGQEWPPLADLAPDPFELTARDFYGRLQQKRRAIKPLLLDQRFISGLGNIYVDESLFRSRIHPLTPSQILNWDQARGLHRLIRQVLREAIRAKGTTVSDYRGPEGIVGGFQHHLRVYDRQGLPCPTCRSPILKTRVGGRGTHLCGVCQTLKKNLKNNDRGRIPS